MQTARKRLNLYVPAGDAAAVESLRDDLEAHGSSLSEFFVRAARDEVARRARENAIADVGQIDPLVVAERLRATRDLMVDELRATGRRLGLTWAANRASLPEMKRMLSMSRSKHLLPQKWSVICDVESVARLANELQVRSDQVTSNLQRETAFVEGYLDGVHDVWSLVAERVDTSAPTKRGGKGARK